MFLTTNNLLVYYGTLTLFGTAGVLFNAFCLAATLLPGSERRERFFQRLIHRHFAAFVRWLEFTRIVRVDYRGFVNLSRRREKLVIVANHPGLMDATYLLARIPEALCVFKSRVRHNPILGAAARAAGYLANDGGVDLLRTASERVAAGATLIVFPEGTRTPTGKSLGVFRPGFALIARRADAPIQLVRITCDTNVLSKGHAWWKLPQLPMRVQVQAGPRFSPGAAVSTAALAAEVEAWFSETTSAMRSTANASPAFASSARRLTV